MRPPRILIIDAVAPWHQGDRALLAGNLKALKKHFPNADIWGLSPFKSRDEAWHGIRFLPVSIYDCDPLGILKLLAFARSADAILWGGGEILTGSSKLGLLFWVVKMTLISLVNRNIYGLFQGVGPAQSSLCERLVSFVVNRTRVFLVRDIESERRLRTYGVHARIIVGHDPAILASPEPLSTPLVEKLKRTFEIDRRFLNGFIGINAYDWFFHRTNSTWLPFMYRRHLPWTRHDPNSELMQKNMAELCDWLVDTYDQNLIFFPMSMKGGAGDIHVCRRIIARMRNTSRTRIIDRNVLGPKEYLGLIGSAQMLIGTRMHATVMATAAGVPAFAFYYLPKGRIYFEQLGCQEFAMPIETLLDASRLKTARAKISRLWTQRTRVKAQLSRRISQMKETFYDRTALLAAEIASTTLSAPGQAEAEEYATGYGEKNDTDSKEQRQGNGPGGR